MKHERPDENAPVDEEEVDAMPTIELVDVLVNNCVGFGLSPFYRTQKVIAYDYPMQCEAIIT